MSTFALFVLKGEKIQRITEKQLLHRDSGTKPELHLVKKSMKGSMLRVSPRTQLRVDNFESCARSYP